MHRRPFTRTRLGLVLAALVASVVGTGTASTAAPASPQALEPPKPYEFVSELDLECFETDPYEPPPVTMRLTHLNPVLRELPPFEATLGPRAQLCAPVAKNGRIPPEGVLEFIRYVDLACYRIEGPEVGFPLTLSHLNPLLRDLPKKDTVMVVPEQLCLPIVKEGAPPPEEVLNLMRYIDLACFRTERPEPLGIALELTQLNPLFADIPPTKVEVRENRQLCVPVRKDDQEIPPEVLTIVQWVDLEKYDISAPPLEKPVELRFQHANPLLAELPIEPATLLSRQQIGLPVAKNGVIPE